MYHPPKIYPSTVGSVIPLHTTTHVVSAVYLNSHAPHRPSSYDILQASAVVTNQFSCTPHLHGWLSENVSISLDGTVTPLTKPDTFLFIVYPVELKVSRYPVIADAHTELIVNESGRLVIAQSKLKTSKK